MKKKINGLPGSDILRDGTEITSVKDYTPNSYDEGWKYIYGVNTTNQTIVKDNLYIKKISEGSNVEMETNYDNSFNLSSSNMKFHPYFGMNKTNMIVTANYYYPYIGDKVFVLLSRILNYIRSQWNEETYKEKITLLKDDFELIIKLINNMTTTDIDLSEITSFYDINKAIVEPVYKDYVKRISIVELFNLYRTVRDNTMSTYCYKFLNGTRKYPFERNGVDLEIVSEYTDNEGVYLSYYVPQGIGVKPYGIWYCNEYKELPAEFTDKGKTIEFEENGEIKEYYKVIMVRKTDNTWYPMLYFDWGDFDPEEIIKLDPKLIEPQKLTPTSYNNYMKQVYNHITPLAAYMYNYTGSSGELDGKENNQNKPFDSLLFDYKSQFDSSEVYTYWSVKIHLYDFGITVLDYITENLEIIKSFYPNYNFDTSTSEGRDNIKKITGGFIGYIDYYLRDNRIKPSYDQVGSFINELFIYDPQKLPGIYNDVYYTPEDFLSKRPTLPPMPEGYEPFIEDIGEYNPTMNYIYSKQNSIIMSMDELTTEDKEDIESYTKYTITN